MMGAYETHPIGTNETIGATASEGWATVPGRKDPSMGRSALLRLFGHDERLAYCMEEEWR